MTEFGVALFYVTTTDGAQNNTIQNNTISLNRTYLNTFGIYSNTRTLIYRCYHNRRSNCCERLKQL